MWTKLFLSGEKISEPESWSNTSLDFMSGVEFTYRDCKIGIYGPGKYWQSDTYNVDLGSGNIHPILVKRRVSKYIDIVHVGKIENALPSFFTIDFASLVEPGRGGRWDFIDTIGYWYVVEIDMQSKKVINYLSKERF